MNTINLKKKGTLSLLLMLCLALLLAACSNNGTNGQTEPSPSPDGEQPDAAANEGPFELGSEPLSFTFYGNYDWWPTDIWGTDPSSAWVQENLQVTVEQIASGGAAEQKLTTMIAANDLPNVLMVEKNDLERLREGGSLVALDDYIDKYPNLKKYVSEETLNLLRSSDGKLYGFPNWYTSSPNGNAGYVINTQIYKELGEPKLETFDDLYDYLKRVKENYPNVVPLEVDRSAWGVEMMASGFEANYLNRYIHEKAVPRGDQMTSLWQDPTYIAALQYASKLAREGLMTQDAFTQTGDQVEEKLRTGRVAVYASANVPGPAEAAHNLLREANPDAGYKAIWPLHADGVNKDEVYPNTYTSLGWNLVAISKTAADPEKIFAYLDWATGPEGQGVLNFGPQGRYWDSINEEGFIVPNEAWTSTPQSEKDKDKLGNWNWVGNTYLVDGAKAQIEMALPEGVRNWGTEQQVNVFWKTSVNADEFYDIRPARESEEGNIRTALDDLYEATFARALFAKSEEEVATILNNAHESAMNQGYAQYLQAVTANWQANKARMQGQ